MVLRKFSLSSLFSIKEELWDHCKNHHFLVLKKNYGIIAKIKNEENLKVTFIFKGGIKYLLK